MLGSDAAGPKACPQACPQACFHAACRKGRPSPIVQELARKCSALIQRTMSNSPVFRNMHWLQEMLHTLYEWIVVSRATYP